MSSLGGCVKSAEQITPSDQWLRFDLNGALSFALIPIRGMIDDLAVYSFLLPLLWERMNHSGDHLVSEACSAVRTEKLPWLLGLRRLLSFFPDLQTKTISARALSEISLPAWKL